MRPKPNPNECLLEGLSPCGERAELLGREGRARLVRVRLRVRVRVRVRVRARVRVRVRVRVRIS